MRPIQPGGFRHLTWAVVTFLLTQSIFELSGGQEQQPEINQTQTGAPDVIIDQGEELILDPAVYPSSLDATQPNFDPATDKNFVYQMLKQIIVKVCTDPTATDIDTEISMEDRDSKFATGDFEKFTDLLTQFSAYCCRDGQACSLEDQDNFLGLTGSDFSGDLNPNSGTKISSKVPFFAMFFFLGSILKSSII